MKPDEMKILVIGDRAWGKGDTLNEALGKLKDNGGKRTHYIAYVVHPDSYVTDMGGISYPIDYPPKEFHRQGIKEKKAA